MIDIPHIGFIVAAYALTFVVMGGTVAAVLLDRRSLLRSLERLSKVARASPHNLARSPREAEQDRVGIPTRSYSEARAGHGRTGTSR